MPKPAWICRLGRVPYLPTANLQRALRSAREDGAMPDTLLALEHEPVITTGYRTEPHEVAYALTRDIPVVPTERGGKATWHGPGQIVVYPVFDLRAHGEDVRAFVRGLEQAIIDTLAAFDISGERRCEYPGVWVEGRKIASLGIRVTRWVSFHGIALNVDCDLEPFSWFTPCGIADVSMTSMAQQVGAAAAPLADVERVLASQIAEQFDLKLGDVPRDRLATIAADFAADAPAPAVRPPLARAATTIDLRQSIQTQQVAAIDELDEAATAPEPVLTGAR